MVVGQEGELVRKGSGHQVREQGKFFWGDIDVCCVCDVCAVCVCVCAAHVCVGREGGGDRHTVIPKTESTRFDWGSNPNSDWCQ